MEADRPEMRRIARRRLQNRRGSHSRQSRFRSYDPSARSSEVGMRAPHLSNRMAVVT